MKPENRSMKSILLILVLLNINCLNCADTKALSEEIELSEHAKILKNSILQRMSFVFEEHSDEIKLLTDASDEKVIKIIRDGLITQSDIEKVKKIFYKKVENQENDLKKKNDLLEIIEEFVNKIVDFYKEKAKKSIDLKS